MLKNEIAIIPRMLEKIPPFMIYLRLFENVKVA
jgi:hypothetical protein